MPVYSFKKIVSESYRVLLVSVAIGLAAGYLLDFMESTQSGWAFAIILAMVPPINGVGGNIGSILGARLSSALHLGTITPDFHGQETLKLNVFASVTMAVLVYSFVGLIFFLFSLISGRTLFAALRIVSIFFGAGMLLISIIIVTSISAAFFSYRRGVDPDNVVIPVVTTVVDLSGVVSLLIMVSIIGV